MSRLSEPQIRSLWQAFRREPASIELRNRLIELYLPYVKALARRTAERLVYSVSADDLVSAGVFGLRDAIEGFDLNAGTKFEAYAQRRILGAMLDDVRANDHLSRIDRGRLSQFRKAGERLTQRLGRYPTEEEVAGELGLSDESLRECGRVVRAAALHSLDSAIEAEESGKEYQRRDSLAANDAGPVRGAKARDLWRVAAAGLRPTERLIVRMYYWKNWTMVEIANRLGISESRVSQLHTRILNKLQRELAGLDRELVED